MTENERIKQVRKSMNLTLEAFGQRIGVTRAAISNIENGVRSVTEQMRRSVCREFGVSEDWLLTGEGKMIVQTPSSEVDELARKYNLTPEARILVERFLLLKPEVQQGIVDYIVDAAAVINGEKTEEKSIDQMVEEYRAELLAAQKGMDGSSALQTTDEKSDKMA